jgi:hypothetical protein
MKPSLAYMWCSFSYLKVDQAFVVAIAFNLSETLGVSVLPELVGETASTFG